MAAGAVGARQNSVRVITDHHVGKRKLLLALEHRLRLTANEVAALELLEGRIEFTVRRERFERVGPEHFADHGGIHEESTLACGQRIEPRRPERADAGPKRPALRLADRRCELLDEERVSL